MRYEVVESKLWVRDDGRTASPYGANPWTSDAERPRWTLQVKGWTVRNPHTGEVGVGRTPWANREDAERFAAEHRPSRIGIGD
jgi:hypothetical protein